MDGSGDDSALLFCHFFAVVVCGTIADFAAVVSCERFEPCERGCVASVEVV